MQMALLYNQFESFISELETKAKNDKTTETPDVLEVRRNVRRIPRSETCSSTISRASCLYGRFLTPTARSCSTSIAISIASSKINWKLKNNKTRVAASMVILLPFVVNSKLERFTIPPPYKLAYHLNLLRVCDIAPLLFFLLHLS